MRNTRVFRLPAWLSLAGLLVVLLVPAVASATFPAIIKPVGTETGDFLGRAVSSAGDFNGDGYDDVIVGRMYSDNGTHGGAALIYFGGPKSDDVADLVLRGQAPTTNEQFGWTVASAGDVNNDGYGDVIVGAAGCDLDGTDAGRAYVYYGGATPNGAADVTLHGEAAGDLFGGAVAGAGDVNGDGYDDVIVGASFNSAIETRAGRAYVFLGGASMNATADLTLTGTDPANYFGCSVAGAGDVNDDGYDDMIIGAYANTVGGTYAGRAYVYFGGSTLNTKPDVTMTGDALDYLGYVVSPAGDINNDGYDDWMVSASNPQKVYVYYGGAIPNSTADLTFTLTTGHYSYYSHTIARAGNVNGDRYSDILIGAYGGASSTGGAVYVYFGGVSADTIPDLTLTGKASGDAFGFALASAGDWNSDGRDDIIVGAYSDDAGGSNAGRFYVFDTGSATPAANRLEWTIPGAAMGDWLGCSVSSAGDFNGDGYDDVLVGAQLNDAGGADAGRVYIVRGGPNADPSLALTFTGGAAGDQCGAAVAAAGDLNNDGYGDILVSAPWNDYGATDGGMVYVQCGGNPSALPAYYCYGTTVNERFGTAIGAAGDVNNDGYDDWIIGSPRATGGGKAYVYLGGAAVNTTADVTLTAAAVGDEFGCSVGTAGDVNGDGYDDVIVGAHLNDAGGANAGRAYVYYGGAAGPNTVADLILTGEALGDRLGISVATAGDVNGDGFADVIVGAHLNDAGGMDAGRAYVYFGGPNADNVADMTLTGVAAGDYFGNAVGPAGDVNLDGCGDIFVTAPLNDGSATDAGRVYIFYGALPSTTSDWTFSGEVAYDHFGTAAACAGDVFGDGVPDFIVGAPLNDASGGVSGEAYVYNFNRYHVTSPNGGEHWIGGATQTVSWLGTERADLYLSLDAGANWDLVGENLLVTATVTAPNVGEDDAMVKLVPREFWVAGSDVSDSLFSIVGPISVDASASGVQFRAPYPNPAGAVVTLGFDLAKEAVVTVTVFDAQGREVARPIAGERLGAGRITREWRPDGLAPGVYTVRAALGEARRTRRLVWLGGK
jgi:hypothetical protein